MKNQLRNTFSTIVLLLMFILTPSWLSACGMGAIGGLGGLAELFMIAIGLFLIGYLPYLFLSIKLARQASSPNGTTKSTRQWASFFAGINTLVFLCGVGFIASNGIELFIGDLLLWGIPFLFFLKGIKDPPSSNGDELLGV